MPTADRPVNRTRPRRTSAGSGAVPDDEPQPFHGRWGWVPGALAYDLRGLPAAQAARIAPVVVEAAWRRNDEDEPLLLVHGGDRKVAAVLRLQLAAGDWMSWAYCHRAKGHTSTPTRLQVALRARRRTFADIHRDGPLPDLEPGCEDFDRPRCVGQVVSGAQCAARAAAGSAYCRQHNPPEEPKR